VRGYFRLHLATVIVATLVAGVLLGLNIRGRTIDVRGTESNPASGVPVKMPGWPFQARSIEIAKYELRDDGPHVKLVAVGNWAPQIVFINTVVALLILLATTVTCESFLRCRSLPRTVAASSD